MYTLMGQKLPKYGIIDSSMDHFFPGSHIAAASLFKVSMNDELGAAYLLFFVARIARGILHVVWTNSSTVEETFYLAPSFVAHATDFAEIEGWIKTIHIDAPVIRFVGQSNCHQHDEQLPWKSQGNTKKKKKKKIKKRIF